jgi:radical SAM protein with 4Fe4S-binding SPASM domain
MHHSTPTACEMDAFLSMKEEEIREEKERAVRVAEENGVDIHFDFWPSVGFHFNQRPHRVFIRDVIESWLLKTFPDFCFMAASYANINQNANVTPCCIPGPDLLMGNLLQQNPMEVWNGENFGKLRKSFFTKEYFKTCRGCPHLRRGEWSAGRSSDDDSP